MYGFENVLARRRSGVIVISAIARSHGLRPAEKRRSNALWTNVVRCSPSRAASARARSISRPCAYSTSEPLTTPTWNPSLGRSTPTVSWPGVSVGGATAAPAARNGQGAREHRCCQEPPHRELASTLTGMPTSAKSYSHLAVV